MIVLLANSQGVLEIDDDFKTLRTKAFFCLDDISEAQGESIFNFLVSVRDESPFQTVVCLKLLGDLIKKYQHVYNYIQQYSSVSKILTVEIDLDFLYD
jgi:hypothetical protein